MLSSCCIGAEAHSWKHIGPSRFTFKEEKPWYKDGRVKEWGGTSLPVFDENRDPYPPQSKVTAATRERSDLSDTRNEVWLCR